MTRRPPREMSRAELESELEELRRLSESESELRDLIEELSAHQEELRQNQHQLTLARVELETSRDRYAELFDFAPMPFLILDLQGMVRGSNLATAQLFGMPRARIDETPLVRWIGRDQRSAFLDELARARRGEGLVHCELVVVTNSRREVPIELTLKRVNPLEHEPQLYCVLTDLTDRRRAERERLQNEQERARLEFESMSAREANQAKDRFLAVLSHELRTPLTPMMLGLGLLESSDQIPATVRNTVSMMLRNLRLEARLIDDLLDVTRISHGKLRIEPEVVDLHAVLSEVVGMCRAEIDANNHEITLDLAAPAHHVEGDPTRLRQVFWNLLQNAVRITPPGGRIEITTQRLPIDRVRIAIEDNGPGIAPEELERIFQPFEQGESGSRRGGLGLGLAVSRGLVRAHGGTLHAENTSKGARFEVVLNVCADPQEHAPAGESSRPPPKPVELLLVEDHPDTASALAEFLQRFGHRVRIAHSLAQARELAEAGPFDLLVSDIQLPDGTGLELIVELRKRGPVRGVAMTGFGSDEDVARSRRAGFERHLVKPVSGQEVARAIEEIVLDRRSD
jgi:PAS domain S-box-containing protein